MSLSLIRGIAGAMILFLGRELSFLFSAAMAAFLGARLTPLLPSAWPSWSATAFVITLAVLAAILTAMNESAGFYVSGFLIGGYAFTEYFAPNSLSIPLLPFIVGSVLGAVIIGLFNRLGNDHRLHLHWHISHLRHPALVWHCQDSGKRRHLHCWRARTSRHLPNAETF